MGMENYFTDKLIKRNYEIHSCIIERIMRYKNDNSNNKTSRI